MKAFVLTGPSDKNWALFFSRRIEPPRFYLSKEELVNCPAFFQEGLMRRNEKAYHCWTTMLQYSGKSGCESPDRTSWADFGTMLCPSLNRETRFWTVLKILNPYLRTTNQANLPEVETSKSLSRDRQKITGPKNPT